MDTKSTEKRIRKILAAMSRLNATKTELQAASGVSWGVISRLSTNKIKTRHSTLLALETGLKIIEKKRLKG